MLPCRNGRRGQTAARWWWRHDDLAGVGPLSTNYSATHRALDIVANQGVPIKSALAAGWWARQMATVRTDGTSSWSTAGRSALFTRT